MNCTAQIENIFIIVESSLGHHCSRVLVVLHPFSISGMFSSFYLTKKFTLDSPWTLTRCVGETWVPPLTQVLVGKTVAWL